MKTTIILALGLLLLAGAALGGETASADGVAVHYDTAGSGAPALVFVHGWSCDRSYWRHQVGEFAETHTVVTVDLAGHGDSGLGRTDWSIPAFAADVAAVVDALELEDVVLIGHSMSGPIIVEAARLLGDRVRGLIPVDTLHDVGHPPTEAQIGGLLASFDGDFRRGAQGFVRAMFPADADPALVDLVANDMAAAPPEIALAAMRGLFAHDVRPSLAALTAPVICLNADMWPADLAGNREIQPKFDLILLAGAGHFLFLEQPEVFNGKLAEILRRFE